MKLGYGGTQAEMVRLINDSGILSEKIENLDNVSFDQMIEAIHAVQTNLGITGTTALEAATTIEGSTNAMKAAWTNLLTGIAREDADLGGLMDSFAQSVATAGSNILPRVQTILENMGSLVEQQVPEIVSQIPALLAQVGGPLVEAGGQLLAGIGSGLMQAVPELLEQAQTALGALRDAFLQLVPTLAQSLREKTPEFISSGLEMLTGLSASLRENVGMMVDAALELVKSLAQGIAEGIPDLIEKGPEIVSNLANTINDNAPKILAAGVDILITLGKGLLDAIPTLVANIPQIISAIVDVFSAFNWVNLGKSIITGLGNGIKNMIAGIKTISTQVKTALTNGLKNLPQELLGIGKNAVQGLINGIKGAFNGVKDAAKNLAGGLVSTVKNALGIHSPSTLFRDEIGQYISLGVAEGIADSSDKAVQAADKLAQDVYTRSKEWADRQTKYLNLSLEEQLAVWEAIQGQFVQDSRQYAEAEEKIFDLRQKRQAEYYDELTARAERQAKYQKTSLLEQLAVWRGIQDQFVRDSKEYAAAEEKIFDLKEKLQDEYLSKVEESNKKIADLEKSYQDTLSNRTDAIFNTYKLFDKVGEREEVAGEDLLRNLSDQVSSLSGFYSGLDQLAARGVSEDLIADIRAMGPGARDELDALLDMTDSMLDEYVDLYQWKQQLAGDIAVKELRDLREQTDREMQQSLDEVRRLYEQTAPAVGRTFTDGLVDGMVSGLREVEQAGADVGEAFANAMQQGISFDAGSLGADVAPAMTQGGGLPANYWEAMEASARAAGLAASRGTGSGGTLTLGELEQALGNAISGMEVRMDGQRVGRVVETRQEYDRRSYGN